MEQLSLLIPAWLGAAGISFMMIKILKVLDRDKWDLDGMFLNISTAIILLVAIILTGIIVAIVADHYKTAESTLLGSAFSFSLFFAIVRQRTSSQETARLGKYSPVTSMCTNCTSRGCSPDKLHS